MNPCTSPFHSLIKLSAAAVFGLLFAFGSSVADAAIPPAVGDVAPNFTLKTLENQSVELKQLAEEHSVVLVVLRGWPGYQCPLCTKQVHDFVPHAEEFAARGAQVVMVYPGPAAQLKAHAQEFISDKSWPQSFLFVIDPDYTFTNAYGLRWKAAKETAYPSTFVIERSGRISFAQISKSHGGRVAADQVLAQLK